MRLENETMRLKDETMRLEVEFVKKNAALEVIIAQLELRNRDLKVKSDTKELEVYLLADKVDELQKRLKDQYINLKTLNF